MKSHLVRDDYRTHVQVCMRVYKSDLVHEGRCVCRDYTGYSELTEYVKQKLVDTLKCYTDKATRMLWLSILLVYLM